MKTILPELLCSSFCDKIDCANDPVLQYYLTKPITNDLTHSYILLSNKDDCIFTLRKDPNFISNLYSEKILFLLYNTYHHTSNIKLFLTGKTCSKIVNINGVTENINSNCIKIKARGKDVTTLFLYVK